MATIGKRSHVQLHTSVGLLLMVPFFPYSPLKAGISQNSIPHI